MRKTSRAAFKNWAVKASSSARAARSRRSRSSASCSSRLASPRCTASSHSSMSTSPSFDVSSTCSAFSRRAGWSKNCRLSSPHVRKNFTTSLSSATALTISVFVSVPLLSLSIIWKHWRAAFRNSAVNSSISLRAALACASRWAARASNLFASAVSMADSHSGALISPSRSVSSVLSAISSRAGTSRYCRF